MKKHPEYMILIALGVALVVSIIAGMASCSMVTTAITSYGVPTLPENIGGPDGGQGDEGTDGIPGGGNYTEEDVPTTMVIDVPELTDDLQAVINSDITTKLNLGSEAKITVNSLTKETVADPELKGYFVISQVSGTAEITNAAGKSATIEYTSYYYAEDPTAGKITWYIYGYDLSSYDLLPQGFERIAGDPMNVRGIIQGTESPHDGIVGGGTENA